MISKTPSSSPDSAIISIENLRKRYRLGLFGRGVEALRGATLDVRPGEIFGLLGPNGAGKTTLVKILLGIVSRSSGSAKMLGYNAGDRRSRRRVGYLPEHLRIAAHHNARSALDFYGQLSGMSRSDIRTRGGALIELVGLKNRDKESVRRFSKGMLQRLGLAQALLHGPEIVFLDEPTDGLDPVGRSQVRSILQELRDEGKTIFLNSHLLQEVELVCDRVAIMDKGKLKYVGTIDDLTPTAAAEVTIECIASESDAKAALDNSTLSLHEQVELRLVDDKAQIVVSTDEQSVLDSIVDALRDAKISISSIQERKQTLEDAFLRLVSEPAGGA